MQFSYKVFCGRSAPKPTESFYILNYTDIDLNIELKGFRQIMNNFSNRVWISYSINLGWPLTGWVSSSKPLNSLTLSFLLGLIPVLMP